MIAYFKAGHYLIVSENARISDSVIVLSGESGRLTRGLDVYRAFSAEWLIISNANNPDIRKDLAHVKLPEGKTVFEYEATSTVDNAKRVKTIMTRLNLHSAIVVSSNFHMRRVQSIFDRIFKNEKDIKITYAFYESRQFDPDRWWESKSSLMITMNEYAKLVGNRVGVKGALAKKWLKKLNISLF